jgi:hypothetical protein
MPPIEVPATDFVEGAKIILKGYMIKKVKPGISTQVHLAIVPSPNVLQY